jgi:hypothetical protein
MRPASLEGGNPDINGNGGGGHPPLTPDDEPPLGGGEPPIPPVGEEPPTIPPVGGGEPPVTIPPAGGGEPPVTIPPAGGGGQPGGGFNAGTIQEHILRILNQGSPDANDPAIRDQLNAARAEGQRGFDRDRAMLAERRAATGLSGGGGFETGIRGLSQAIGQKQQGLASGLVADAQRQRASQIMAALQLGGGMITASEQNQLQRELANLNASLQREGMSLQNAQFGAGMSQQALLALLMGGYQ